MNELYRKWWLTCRAAGPACTAPALTFPHPGGPHRITDGISCDSRSDRRRVCWPTALLWPKYSSRVFGLSASARGLFDANNARDSSGSMGALEIPASGSWLLCGVLDVSLSGRFSPRLRAGAVGLFSWLETPSLGSLARSFPLLVWNRENTTEDCESAMEEEEEEEPGWLTGSAPVRHFLASGGPVSTVEDGLQSDAPSSRHASRCPLMSSFVKSLKQTGHRTDSAAAMLIPARCGLTRGHVTKTKMTYQFQFEAFSE